MITEKLLKRLLLTKFSDTNQSYQFDHEFWNESEETLKNKMMTKKEFLKSNYFKILLSVLGLVIAIGIWRNGYHFGQWLHQYING